MRRSVETLSESIDAEIEALPPAIQARFIRLMEMAERIGLENMREPHVKHIDGKLWEFRIKAAEGIGRAIYFTAKGRRIIIVHVFVKKSPKMPKTALAIAKQRVERAEI